ncbi:MAG: peptide ABC transporter substrate-binding protein [Clostridia bacterium]|nr:peptide ABC transporter substrate-binding protein [Clostridia bacterium]
MKRKALAVMLAVVLLLLTACSTTNKYGDAFRFPLGGEPKQLDPQMAQDAASVAVLRSLMCGLTALNEQGEPTAAIAERWEVNGATWTFTLRSSAWSDGTAVTAADFVYGWGRAVDPDIRSPLAEKFANVKSVQADGERRLVVELHIPDPHFATVVADTAFFPCHEEFFLKTEGRYGLEAEDVLCNGPFRLTRWEHGEYLIMRRNDGFYAAEDVRPDAVRYVIPEVKDRVKALKEGELDASELTAAEAGKLKGKVPVVAVKDSVFALWFNTSVSALQDAAVRKALRDTLEWQLIREQAASMGHAIDGTDFVPPAASFGGSAYPAGTAADPTIGNSAAGAAVLKAAKLPSLTVICTDNPDELQLARLMVQSWQKNANLYFSLKALTKAEFEAHLAVGNYQIAIGEAVGYSGNAAGALGAYLSDGAENPTRLQDAALAEQLRQADTVGKLLACEQRLHDLCPAVPLWYGERWFATGEEVGGVVIRPFNGHPHGAIYGFLHAEK